MNNFRIPSASVTKNLSVMVLLSLLLLGFPCASGPIVTVTDLRLYDNDVAGWAGTADQYATFDTGNFYELVDGGAPAYINQGLVNGFTQSAKKAAPPDTLLSQIYAMDFGEPSNARRMFADKKTTQGMSDVTPGFDTSEAIASPFLGGYFACAVFDRFYVEVTASGYADPSRALQDAGAFLGVFKSRISGSASTHATDNRKRATDGKPRVGPAIDLRGRRLPAGPNRPSAAVIAPAQKDREILLK
jgi:hypothetical protein